MTWGAYQMELVLNDQEGLSDTIQHQIGRRLLSLSPAITVLHKSILEAAFYKLQNYTIMGDCESAQKKKIETEKSVSFFFFF